MTSVASEAFALLNRPSPSSRTAAPRSGQDDGGFAALMDSHTERHDPKPVRAERNQPRRVERESPSDKPEPADSTATTAAPAQANDAKTADQTSDKPGAEAADAATPADDTTPAPDAKADDPANIVTGIVAALPVDTTATLPAVPVATAPVATTPVEAPTAPTETAPAAAAATTPATPAATTPTTATPDQPQSTEAAGTPAETAPATATPGSADQEQAVATAAPQVKAQTTSKPDKEKTSGVDTVADATDNEANPDALAADEADDASKPAKHPTAQNTTNVQGQTHVEKPGVKSEHNLKPDDLLPAPKLTADHTTQVMPQMPAHATAATAATPQASPVSTSQAVPLNAIAVEIAGQAKAGNSRFEIRLDPPELGRIDVRLDVDKDGNVTSRLVIERADTYDLLRRDQSSLERALQQAGLKTSDNALEFSLRDQGFAQQQRQDDETPRGIRTLVAESDVMPSEAANGYARLLGGRSGVDIRV